MWHDAQCLRTEHAHCALLSLSQIRIRLTSRTTTWRIQNGTALECRQFISISKLMILRMRMTGKRSIPPRMPSSMTFFKQCGEVEFAHFPASRSLLNVQYCMRATIRYLLLATIVASACCCLILCRMTGRGSAYLVHTCFLLWFYIPQGPPCCVASAILGHAQQLR